MWLYQLNVDDDYYIYFLFCPGGIQSYAKYFFLLATKIAREPG